MIQRIAREGDDVVVDLSGKPQIRVTVTSLTGSAAGKAEKARAIIQAVLDVRTLISSLPSDDPDKTVNPNRPDLFWSDSNGLSGNTHITGRAWVVAVEPTTYHLTFTRTN